MAEADIIAQELRGMQDLDGVIATHLPNIRTNSQEEVAQLQQLLNILYPDAQELSIDGSLGPKTMSALRVWLGQTQFLEELTPGARNTVINPDVARTEGRANGYIPFQDDMLAETVYSAAREAQGMEDTIEAVLRNTALFQSEDLS